LADPFAIYARHVLRLRPLDPLEQETDALDYGSLVHTGLEIFLQAHGPAWPPRADLKLREAMGAALAQAQVRPALAEWWLPRLYRIADWVAEQERDRRATSPPEAIVAERRGEWRLTAPDFLLTGRADRIERHAGGLLSILDYKTGEPPSQKAVDEGFAPQLPLEAAMAAAGGFGADVAGQVAELTYWHLTGGFVPGEARALFKGDALRITDAAATAAASLAELIAAFDDPATPYLSIPHPGRVPRRSDHAQLARRAEWAEAGDDS
jgi:ATP-dependent helicase/nuclease subunit B